MADGLTPHPPGDRRGWPQYRDCPTDLCAAQDQHTPACLAAVRGPTTPDGQPLYTLEQARPLIVRERCRREGHDLRRDHLVHNGAGYVVVEHWFCDYGCDVQVILKYPDPQEGQ